jgi:hypothetical protein
MLSTNLVPPFFGPRQPVYPVVPSVIRVTGPAQGSVYPCQNQQAAGGVPTLRDREAGWVFEPNGVPVPRGTYRARLVGNFNGLPLYVVSLICCVGRGSFSSISGSSASSQKSSFVSSALSSVSSVVSHVSSVTSSQVSQPSQPSSAVSVPSSPTSITSGQPSSSVTSVVSSVTSKISSQFSASSCNLRTQFCLLVTPICSSSSSSVSSQPSSLLSSSSSFQSSLPSQSSSSSGNQTCCPGLTVPNTIFATVTGTTNCNGTYTLTYNPTTNQWENFSVLGLCPTSSAPTFAVKCQPTSGGGIWHLIINGQESTGLVSNCSPFVLEATSLPVACNCIPTIAGIDVRITF